MCRDKRCCGCYIRCRHASFEYYLSINRGTSHTCPYALSKTFSKKGKKEKIFILSLCNCPARATIKTFAFILIFAYTVYQGQACRSHGPPSVPQSYIGTVGQGCTPKVIIAVSQLITNPTKCDLPLGDIGCNLCGLRMYKPETTTSRFLIQPLTNDFSTAHADHVEAMKCKCSEGCYFHKASITQLGIELLPSGISGVTSSFSEPFACYSGISTPSVASYPSFTFLIWCENDGGCSNTVVARYLYFARFETLSPNRPATTRIFVPKITTLPSSKCLIAQLPQGVRDFISGTSTATLPPSTTLPVPLKA